MSDYLTRMAERAAGRAPAVRPLVAPLFAPPASGVPAWEESAGIGEGTPLLTPPAAVAGPGRGHRTEWPALPQEAVAIDGGEAAHRAAPSEPAQLSRRQAETGTAPAAERHAVASASPATGGGRGAKAVAAESVALQEHGSAGAIPATDGGRMPEPPLAGRDTFARAARIVRRRGDGEGDALLLGEVQRPPGRDGRNGEAAIPRETVPTSPGEMRPKGAAPADRHVEKVAAERGASVVALHGAAEAAPPTIRISIGRIEVRAPAPQPPATARPAAPPAAKVSLDDYLRKQSGGAR